VAHWGAAMFQQFTGRIVMELRRVSEFGKPTFAAVKELELERESLANEGRVIVWMWGRDYARRPYLTRLY
jgi:hypothetical protein